MKTKFTMNFDKSFVFMASFMIVDILSIALMCTAGGADDMRRLLVGTSLERLFRSDQWISIWGMCICALTAGIVLGVALLVEMKISRTVEKSDQLERGVIALFFIIPSSMMIIFIRNPIIPVVFIATHCGQVTCTHFLIASFVQKLLPEHFSFKVLTFSNICVLLAAIFFIFGHGSPFSSVHNVLSMVTGLFGFGTFGYLFLHWVNDQNILLKWRQANPKVCTSGDDDLIEVKEALCLLYGTSYILTIMITSILTCSYRADFTRFDEVGVLTFMGLFVLFGIFVSTIPAQVTAMLSRTRMQQESDKKVEHAQQLLDTKKNCIRYLSHELRSPLGALSLSLDFAIDDAESGEADIGILTTELKSMKACCDSSTQILDQTLMAEQIGAGLFEINAKKVCAMRTTVRLLEPMALYMRVKALSFELINLVSVPGLVMKADALKIDQVIRNLFSNAAKFSPKHATVKASIRFEPNSMETSARIPIDMDGSIPPPGASSRVAPLTLAPPDARARARTRGDSVSEGSAGHLIVDVMDSGPGISEENAKKLFGQFIQFNSLELQGGGGFGLGMWLSREIMLQHGGTLTYKPRTNGAGSVFSLAIPCYVDEAYVEVDTESEPAPAHKKKSTQEREPIASYTETVRVIDDSMRRGDFGSKEEDEEQQQQQQEAKPNSWYFPHIHVVSSLAISATISLDESIEPAGTSGRPHKLDVAAADAAFTCPPRPMTIIAPCEVRILVVDDSEPTRKVVANAITRYFKAAKMTDPNTPSEIIVFADDGVSALAKMHESIEEACPFDLVILDNIMIEMNGPQAAQRMREAGYGGLIVGHTGNVINEDVQDFLAHGANMVMKKPLKLGELSVLLDQVVTGKLTC